MTTLRLTAAGRAAMADGTNRALANVQLRAIAIGDGTGPGGAADDARVALRSERGREAVTGTAMAAGRLAVRANFSPTEVYSVTEAGIIARIGDSGAEFLLAYWAVERAANALATTVSGVTLVIAGVMDITHAAAEVNVSVDASITLGGPGTLAALSDAPDVFGAGLYLRANNTATAAVWDEAPPVVADEDALPTPAAAVNSVYLVQNYSGTGEPVIAQLAGNAWHYTPTRAWVRAQIADLVGAAPATLDTVYELAAALENNADIIAALRALIGDRLTRSQVDARIAALAPKDVVLASDVDVTLARTTHALAEPLDNFRWLDLIRGNDNTVTRVPRADITQHVASAAALYALVEAGPTSSALRLHTVDPATGELTPVGPAVEFGGAVAGATIAAIATQLFAMISSGGLVQLYTVNAATGALTPVGPGVAVSAGGIGLALHGGAVYALSTRAVPGASVTLQLHTVDLATGELTPVGPGTAVSGASGIGLASDGGPLYAAAVITGRDPADPLARLHTVNAATGALTPVGPGVAVPGATGIGLALHGGTLYAGISSRVRAGGAYWQLYTVNTATGVFTPVGVATRQFETSAAAIGLASGPASTGGVALGHIILDRDAAARIGVSGLLGETIHQVIGIR